MTGDTNIPAVPTRTSDLQNDSDYQTGADVQSAISGKQDVLTPGTGINISNDTISIDSTVVATQQNLANEVTNRENADNALQGQIDAISASSDVVDIVGTYAELQNYDTSELSDNDIIKVLQDETQNNATTYYRWSTTTQSFTLIGQEGPYYTKAAADAQFVPQTRTVNGKPLSTNITLDASDVSALGQADIVQTTGNSTTKVMSQKATTDGLNAINNLLEGMPSDFFSGDALASAVTGTTLRIQNALSLDDMKVYGDTFQQTYSGKNLFSSPIIIGGWAADGGTLSRTTRFKSQNKMSVSSNTIYTISGTPKDSSKTLNITVQTYDSNEAIISQFPSSNTWGNVPFTFTTPSDCVYITISGRYSDDTVFGTVGDTTDAIQNVMLELGSSATSYEPFTGGQPSPSPDYPQNIDIVTGVQTVTVDDGDDNSQTYTIDLGSIELCKIGDYQDYIYKGSDGWYVHKDIGKVVYDGTQSWAFESYAFFRSAEGPIINSTVAIYAISDKFLGYNSTNALSVWSNYPNNVIAIRNRTTYAQIGIKTDVASTAADFKTWLTVYYVLETPTDTKITDQTLIDGLNSALNMTCYDGETNVVVTSTNLAGALELVAVNANAKGLIYKARKGA